MFAPKYVENKLKFFPYIKEAVAFGDRRDRVCAFINIDFDAVGNWAEKRNLPYAGYAELAQKPEVAALIRDCVREGQRRPRRRRDAWPAARSAASWCCTRNSTPTTASSRAPARSAAATSASATRCWSTRCTAAATEQYIETAMTFEDGRSGKVSATLQIVDVDDLPGRAERAL